MSQLQGEPMPSYKIPSSVIYELTLDSSEVQLRHDADFFGF
jgi:hypothetical protein